MDHLSGYAHRLPSFVRRYLCQRRGSHVIIVACVMAAVACSVGSQYGVKHPVDGLSGGPVRLTPYGSLAVLVCLIARDNFLWRIGSRTASFAFVGVK
jgi:ATP-binding cassette subfamily B protein